jgi:hypothetical protein
MALINRRSAKISLPLSTQLWKVYVTFRLSGMAIDWNRDVSYDIFINGK